MVSFQAVLEEFNRAFLGLQQAEDNLDEGGLPPPLGPMMPR